LANLKQAELAREQFSDELARCGAHAVGVERQSDRGGWAVIAFVAPSAKFNGPANLMARHDSRTVPVPVIVRREETFSPG
jgi:hypothetical protein